MKKVFLKNICRSVKILGLEILKISENPNKSVKFFEKSKMFEIFEHKFSSIEKYFLKNSFQFVFYIFVKCMNVAFQQAIGHLLTPSGGGEQAI